MNIPENITEQTTKEPLKKNTFAIEIKEVDNTHSKLSAIPYDMNDFLYSKKHHFDFFRHNFYAYELYKNQNLNSLSDIEKYQNQITYFFIQKYVPIGSNILVIGKGYERIFDRLLSNKHSTCWILENPDDLRKDPPEVNFKIRRYDNEKETLNIYYSSFDFIFTVSGLDNILTTITETESRNIVFNLNRFLKPGGFINLNFTIRNENGKFRYNNLVYSFYKDYYPNLLAFIPYLYPLSAAEDETLLRFNEQHCITGKSKKDINDKTGSSSYSFSFHVLLKKEIYQISNKTVWSPGDYLKKRPAYFFHHLIKCGGSSLGVVLSRWFKFETDMYDKVEGIDQSYRYDYDCNINQFKKYKFNIENLSSDYCIRGHYQHEGILIHQRYPEIFRRKDEFKVFTFVREPFNVLISLYYFAKKRGYNYHNLSLETYLKTTSNFLAQLLNCNEENYKEVLDRYFFIGIVDRMQESFDKLATILGKRKIKVPQYNTTEKDSQVSELTPEFIEEVKKLNELDYKIYNYSIERFDKL